MILFIEDYIEQNVILIKINMLANISPLAWNLVYRLYRINELEASLDVRQFSF